MEQVIYYINQFITLVGIRNLIIIGIILVLLIIAIIIYRSVRLKVSRSEIVEIENQINSIKTMPIQYRLGRVASIAKNMKEVAVQYDEFSAQYNKLNDFMQNELGVLVNEVDEQLFYGKLHGAKKKLAKLHVMADRYEKDSKDLLKKIEKVTEIENVQRIEIIRVKEKYRTVTNQYDAIRIKVESFVPEVDEIFKSIDEDFVKLEGMMNNQLFDDAKAFTSQIEGRVDRLSECLKDLPSYVSVVKTLLPNKVDKVRKLITDLEEDTYALEELNAYDRYDEIEEELEEATQYVKAVQIEEAASKLETVTDHIESLAVDLTKEKESYKKFKEQWNKLTRAVDKTTEEYDECIEDYGVLKQKFVIDESKITLMSDHESYKDLEAQFEDLKTKFESGEFAYTDMLESVEALLEALKAHREHIISFIKERDGLYKIDKRDHDELENINIVLLEIKSEIKNNHLPMINNSYKGYIADSYKKANEIRAFDAKKPVELGELSKCVDGARDVIYKLYDNVHNLVVTAQMVEEAIVFGNRYRSTYLEVNTELTKAEVLFRNGEYTKALAVAVDMIEKIQPGSYEKMIKKSEA